MLLVLLEGNQFPVKQCDDRIRTHTVVNRLARRTIEKWRNGFDDLSYWSTSDTNGYATALALSDLLSEFLKFLGLLLFASLTYFLPLLKVPFFVYKTRRDFGVYKLLFIV
jgi:hypothetical protein